jgi:hypothetical protein
VPVLQVLDEPRMRRLRLAPSSRYPDTGATVMHVAFQQWVSDPSQAPFQPIARDALAQLREIASAG